MSTSRSRSHRTPRLQHRRRSRRAPIFDCLESRALLALTITVNSTADLIDPNDGLMTLREAIEISNGDITLASLTGLADRALVTGSISPGNGSAFPAPNAIDFSIAASGTQTISVLSTALPAITEPLDIWGYTEPGSSISTNDKTEVVLNNPMVRIDGSSLPGGTTFNGLDVQAPNCNISGLIITGFSGFGMTISGADTHGTWAWGNFIGALPDPTYGKLFIVDPLEYANASSPQLGCLEGGLQITSSNNRIGGNTPGLPNVIANNGYDSSGNPVSGLGWGAGVDIDTPSGTGNLIQGNVIWNNATQGVLVQSSNNTIGEALTGGGNVISANGSEGILITGGETVQGNEVLGNFLGTDLGTSDAKILKGEYATGLRLSLVSGTLFQRFDNNAEGIKILNSPKNFIGGLSTAARNIIGENVLDGIVITGAASTGNRILNNYIGFNVVNGEQFFLPNQNGIVIESPGNYVGDPVNGAGNTISNNRYHGILISQAAAAGNTIVANTIGLNPGGGSNFGNAFDGIHIDNAPNNIIGGTDAVDRNVISGNNNGVYISGAGATGNRLLGNFIGTAADGQTMLGNAVDGVVIDNAPQNYIGDVAAGSANVISGNNNGVKITGAAARDNQIQGNFIGTDLSTHYVIQNRVNGVLITNGAANNLVGGATTGATNTIWHNVGAGVLIDGGTANSVLSNSIYENTGTGILSYEGTPIATPRGYGIVLNAGKNTNNGIVEPTLTAAIPNGTVTQVFGSFDGAPNTTYTLEFFASVAKDPTGFGEGQTPSGSYSVTTDASGHFDIDRSLGVAIPSGQFVTATITDALGNSSAFSNAVPAVQTYLQLSSANYVVNETDGAVTISVTRSGGMLGDVAVDYTVGGGTAVAGVDYTPVSGTLFFNTGDPATKTFTIPILNPNKVGGSVNATITLSNPANGSQLGAQSAATLTINANLPQTVVLGAATASVNENGGSVTLQVTRNTTTGGLTVHYATANGTAIAGVNYTSTSGDLTFAAGEASKTITIPVIDDNVVTTQKTFTLALSSPSAGVLGTPGSTVVTINNTDGPGAFAFTATRYASVPGANSVTIAVTRNAGKSGSVSVVYAALGGDAQPGIDYTPISGRLTFAPNETTKTFTVPLLNTSQPFTNTSFNVYLGMPTGGATIGSPASAAVTILHGTGGGNSGDTIPPVITDFQPVAGASGVVAMIVTYSEPMNAAHASDVGNFGYVVTTPGPDGIQGTYDDGTIALAGARYYAASRQTVLYLSRPLPFGVFAGMAINANAVPVIGRGLIDLNGNSLDGTGVGNAPGTPFITYFGEGQRLVYSDRNADVVTIQVSGPGLLALRRAADGEAQQLRIVGAAPGGTTVTGAVRATRPGGGTTTIPSVVGAAGVNLRLGPQFKVGGISAAAFDTLAVNGKLKARWRF